MRACPRRRGWQNPAPTWSAWIAGNEADRNSPGADGIEPQLREPRSEVEFAPMEQGEPCHLRLRALHRGPVADALIVYVSDEHARARQLRGPDAEFRIAHVRDPAFAARSCGPTPPDRAHVTLFLQQQSSCPSKRFVRTAGPRHRRDREALPSLCSNNCGMVNGVLLPNPLRAQQLRSSSRRGAPRPSCGRALRGPKHPLRARHAGLLLLQSCAVPTAPRLRSPNCHCPTEFATKPRIQGCCSRKQRPVAPLRCQTTRAEIGF